MRIYVRRSTSLIIVYNRVYIYIYRTFRCKNLKIIGFVFHLVVLGEIVNFVEGLCRFLVRCAVASLYLVYVFLQGDVSEQL